MTSCLPDQPLTDAIVFCGIQSRLTGRRLVSLPFSDHCEPLVAEPDRLDQWLPLIARFTRERNWRYAELRPARATPGSDSGYAVSGSYYLHSVNLAPDIDALLRRFHKDCVQRKIRKAEREGLEYTAGRDETILSWFYDLLSATRRRHGVPPQPLLWFRNLVDCFGEDLLIRVASKDGRPVAAILTLRSRNNLIYKYGGSDTRYNHLGGMALLFWKSIEDAKRDGALEFDLGRTDCDNPGLIAFKEHWAAERVPLRYWRCSASGVSLMGNGWKERAAKNLFSRIPDKVFSRAGQLIYRHIG